jgi:DNA-directed RNA polymerase specialized sigma24 family protein
MQPSPLRTILDLAAPAAAAPGERFGEAEVRVDRRDALAQLHLRCARSVFGYVWRRTGDRHVAEDLCSEAFVRAFERLPDLAPTAAPRAWLLRVAGTS